MYVSKKYFFQDTRQRMFDLIKERLSKTDYQTALQVLFSQNGNNMNKYIFFQKKFAGRRDLRFPDGAHQGGPEPGRRDRQRGKKYRFLCVFF